MNDWLKERAGIEKGDKIQGKKIEKTGEINMDRDRQR